MKWSSLVACLILLAALLWAYTPAAAEEEHMPGFPSPIMGTVTIDGAPAQGANVTGTWDWYGMTKSSSCTTNESGVYQITPYASCAVTVTATFNGHSAAIHVDTPADSTVLFGQDIRIVSSGSSGDVTASPTSTAAVSPTAVPSATSGRGQSTTAAASLGTAAASSVTASPQPAAGNWLIGLAAIVLVVAAISRIRITR